MVWRPIRAPVILDLTLESIANYLHPDLFDLTWTMKKRLFSETLQFE